MSAPFNANRTEYAYGVRHTEIRRVAIWVLILRNKAELEFKDAKKEPAVIEPGPCISGGI